MKVKDDAEVLVGDYPYAEDLKKELLPYLKDESFKDIGHTNVKAKHSDWMWMDGNIKVEKIKKYIINETENKLIPRIIDGSQKPGLKIYNFWANKYSKGDSANSHHHLPTARFSFAYFLKAKWYHSPLVFTYSGKKIRPKEGRFVIFHGYLYHHVPKHKHNDTRITLSGNLTHIREEVMS